MIPRPVRLACLAAAAWAVLFAPGAFGDGSRSIGDVEEPSDRFAAAVIAPTFSPDSIVGRSCRTDDDDCLHDDVRVAWTLAFPLALGLGPMVALRPRPGPRRRQLVQWQETARGPPAA